MDAPPSPGRVPPPEPAEDGRRSLGAYGEALAARYLRERGLTVLARNWRCDVGEIDIVALDGRCLVVCEVKTRRGSRFGLPVEAVTWAKLLRLRRLAAAWLHAQEPAPGGPAIAAVRIDVVGVLRPAVGPARLHHIVGVGS